jgi:hypothetical protein
MEEAPNPKARVRRGTLLARSNPPFLVSRRSIVGWVVHSPLGTAADGWTLLQLSISVSCRGLSLKEEAKGGVQTRLLLSSSMGPERPGLMLIGA